MIQLPIVYWHQELLLRFFLNNEWHDFSLLILTLHMNLLRSSLFTTDMRSMHRLCKVPAELGLIMVELMALGEIVRCR